MSTTLLRRRALRVACLLIFLLAGSLLLIELSNRVHAQNGSGGGGTRLLRTPTVSATQIGFAYANPICVALTVGVRSKRVPPPPEPFCA